MEIELRNHYKIPRIGFGTWQILDGETAKIAIKAAVDAGYRHIDTAKIYKNEKSVGEAIKECGISREELFITGKVRSIGVSDFMPHHLKAIMDMDEIPMVNQIEYHPRQMEKKTVEFCREHGIIRENYNIFDFELKEEDIKIIDDMPYFAGSSHHPDHMKG